MNRPIAASLLLLAFAVFCFFCIRTHAPMIQHGITTRVSQALASNGIATDALSVSGRDVLLSGMAGSAAVSDAARKLAGEVNGVRVVNVKTFPSEAKAISSPSAVDSAPDSRTRGSIAETQKHLNALALKNVEFNTGSANLTATGRRTLDEIQPVLAGSPSLLCSINGYTDSSGDPRQNLALSERRAAATRDYLVEHGIAAGRFTVAGYGDGHPIAPNNTQAGRRRNRRIEFVLKEKR